MMTVTISSMSTTRTFAYAKLGDMLLQLGFTHNFPIDKSFQLRICHQSETFQYPDKPFIIVTSGQDLSIEANKEDLYLSEGNRKHVFLQCVLTHARKKN